MESGCIDTVRLENWWPATKINLMPGPAQGPPLTPILSPASFFLRFSEIKSERLEPLRAILTCPDPGR